MHISLLCEGISGTHTFLEEKVVLFFTQFLRVGCGQGALMMGCSDMWSIGSRLWVLWVMCCLNI